MIAMKKSLPRRTILRGLGTALALPLLDAMVPPFTAAGRAAAAPRRLGFVYLPNGVSMNFSGVNYWKPRSEGANFELSPILAPFAPFKQQLIVISGLIWNDLSSQRVGRTNSKSGIEGGRGGYRDG
jgi:hypothetical protein